MTDAAPSAAPHPERLDDEEIARRRRARFERIARWVMPVLSLVASIGAWEWYVRAWDVKPYILPGPIRVAEAVGADWELLAAAAAVTLTTTFSALALAILLGVGLAVLFTLSRSAELTFSPYAVFLQVMPVIAVAPLINIYIDDLFAKTLVCAWIVAFFPILSNTSIGLKSVDHNLRDLFQIYGANGVQRLWLLQLPSALPFFLGGLRIAGGLSLIGAVVAEFVAGTAGQNSGLASRILESSFRNEIPRMFAALILVSLLGIAIFLATSWLSKLVLGKWHESEIKRES